MGLASAIYEGRVRHRRFTPFRREFEYEVYMMYLDLAEIPEVMRIHPLFSTRPRSPVAFRRQDFLPGTAGSLDGAVRALVEERVGRRPAGPVRLLTNPRYLGMLANPVSFYYCFAAGGDRLEAVVAEVTNTPWGDRHCYVLEADGDGGVLRSTAEKSLHVSPLMSMAHRYEFRFGLPGERLPVHIESHEQGGGKAFDATLDLRRRPFARRRLSRLLLRRPPMPVTVLAGIYLQAALTWVRGAKFHARPAGGGLRKGSRPEMLCPMAHDRTSERASGEGAT